METKRERLVLAGAFLVSALLFIAVHNGGKRVPYLIYGSPDYLVPFLESNVVVVRSVYPFSDAQGAVAATAYIAAVMSAKGKRVIVQTIEGNACYTNEGNVERVERRSLSECEENVPTFIIREGERKVVIAPGLVEISGEPPDLMRAASLVLNKIYPDADLVYRRAMRSLPKGRGG